MMETLCSSLLRTWCDTLLRHQIRGTGDPGLDGAILCPSCGRIHGRCGDAIYPFLQMAKEETLRKKEGWEERKEAWINGAKALFFWTEYRMSQEDGSVKNDIDSSWKGITVFYVIQLSEALMDFDELLDGETKVLWKEWIRKAAEFLYSYEELKENNINYPVSNALAMYRCSVLFGNLKYRMRAEEMAHLAENIFTERGLVYGEGVPRNKRTKKGCLPVDMGYNIEETLPSLLFYGEESGDGRSWELAANGLVTQLPFILPDGGIDNSFGTRNYKWTYWGSRTSDGCALAYLMVAKDLEEKDPETSRQASMAAYRNLKLLEDCTNQGLLTGGPHYRTAGQAPCVHHTFTHAKVLAGIRKRGLELWIKVGEEEEKKAADESRRIVCSREEKDGVTVKEYPEIAGWILEGETLRATVTDYDWEYLPGGHVSGGTLSLLWMKDLGTVLCASVGEYCLKEPHNMQIPDRVRQECLALRMEVEKDSVRYSSMYEDQGKISCHPYEDDQGRGVRIEAQGFLKDIYHKNPEGETISYRFVYDFREDQVTLQVFGTQGSLICPVISRGDESVELSENGMELCIRKGDHSFLIQVEEGQLALPYGTERIFHLVPGFQAVRADISLVGQRAVVVFRKVEGDDR